ncbi:MAG: patatin-like phospholipase family protein [Microscillaceae bacterium]|nr:patatin-like phospholipase family protein [Microscillaceae bacterium]MDW8461195.1 patatin-like phospholipase family protein [Cytophagales bacterium]
MDIGITLSGGGARGIAHLGVLQALTEMNIFPKQVVGVSAGAIVGAFYCAGYTPAEVLDFLAHTNLFWFLRPTFFRKAGLIDMDKLEALYRKYFKEDNFAALKIPLTIAATDLNLGQTTFFSEGELIRPILASSCIPVVFSPISFRGSVYVDGGVLNNMPIEPLQNCKVIIGVHTNPYDPTQPLNSARLVLERCLLLAVHQSARRNFDKCDILIEPEGLKRFNPLQLWQFREIYQIGYKYTLKQAPEIEKKLAALLV